MKKLQGALVLSDRIAYIIKAHPRGLGLIMVLLAIASISAHFQRTTFNIEGLRHCTQL